MNDRYPSQSATFSNVIHGIESAASKAKPFVVAGLIVAAVMAITATLQWEWAMALSGFAFGLAKFVMVIGLALLCDKYLLHTFDTLHELKKGNLAVALVCSVALLGLFYLLANC